MVLGSEDIGHRVVVRRVIGERNGRRLFSDALGRLVEITATELTVLTTKGPVRVPLELVHAAKRVPDQRRTTRRDIATLELAANAGWPAPITDRLGEWWLRAAEGWTGRANSALPIGDPGMPVAEAIDAVVRWYTRLGLTPTINVPLPYAADLDAVLAALGWQHRPPTLMQVAYLADLTAAPVATGLPPVRLSELPSPGWLAVAAGRKGGLPAAAHHILTSVDRLRFAEVYADSGDLIAIARGAVTAGWLGISLVEVVPEARRRGLARHVVGELARWGEDAGAVRAYLQVEERNTPATALYERMGFTTHHRYLTRQATSARTR